MVMEGEEKQAGRLWDKFGMQEVVKRKCDTLYVGVGHHHQSNGMCFLSHSGRYASCGSGKDISVSEGEIPSEFGWWDTARARGAREYSMRLKIVFVTFGMFEVCNAYCGASKSGSR